MRFMHSMRWLLRLLPAAVLCAPPGLASQSVPLAQLPQDVTPLRYQIDLTLLPEADRYSGTTRIRVRLARPTARIWLHGLDLRNVESHVLTASNHRIAARYEQRSDQGVVELTLDRTLAPGEATLVFDYDAAFTTRGVDAMAKYVDSGKTYIASFMFPSLARRVFPCFDQPGFKTPFDFRITAHRDHVVITNAPERDTQLLPDGLKRVTFATTAPLPTYLAAVYVGPYDLVKWRPIEATALRKTELPLSAIAAAGKGPRLHYALEHTSAILRELEDYFGTAYPFAKLDFAAVPIFTGAMENAAAITYGENYFVFDERASLVRKRSYAYVHAHELAHQWFGNLVTPAWWDDLWLNESFATWMGNRAIGRWAPERGFERETLRMGLSVMDRDSRIGARALRQPIEQADQISNRWNPLIYEKGSAVLAMFEGYIGEAAFRDGVRLHIKTNPYGTVRAADFLRALERASGSSRISQAFARFVDQPGVPALAVDWSCQKQTLRLNLAQSRYAPLGSRVPTKVRWDLPVCVAFESAGKREKHCTLLQQTEQSWSISVQQCPRWLMPNAGGSGYYRVSMPRQQLLDLVKQLDQLQPAEALSLHDSLAAQVRTGGIDVAHYWMAVSEFARHPEWDVAVAPLPMLTWITRQLHETDQGERARQHVREIYEPVLTRVGLRGDSELDRTQPDAAGLLRDALIPFLALEMRHPRLLAELADLGRKYAGFGTDSALHPEAVDATIAATALAAASQTYGRPFLEHLDKLLHGSMDLVFRSDALIAMANVIDPAQGEWVRTRMLEPGLSKEEVSLFFVRHAAARGNLAAAWDWEKHHLTALASLVSPFQHADLVLASAEFCSLDRRRDVAAFFAPRLASLQDGERALEDALEQIDVCMAVKNRQRASARAVKF